MDYAQKIKQIIAKAESTNSQAESESLMAKAHQLMTEHGLSMLDLGCLDKDDPLGRDEDLYNNASDTWQLNVGYALARYYGCRLISADGHTKSATKWVIFGRESARITFNLMWPFIDAATAR